VRICDDRAHGGRGWLSWLRERKRDWREVVRIFLEAGRGLEAAHQAGVSTATSSRATCSSALMAERRSPTSASPAPMFRFPRRRRRGVDRADP